MPLKDFTIQQMFRITQRWSGKLRPIIEGSTELTGSLITLTRAHSKLFSPAQLLSAAPDPLKLLQEEGKTTDIDHDRYARGTIYMLFAYASAVSDILVAERYINANKTLFPAGLETTSKAHNEEAGAVELLEKNLTPELNALLSEIPIKDGGNLLDWVLAHIKHGKNLGEIEDKKDELKKAQAEATSTSTTVAEARLFWIRAVHAFLDAVALAEISEETRGKILAPVQKAEAVVERRKKGEVVVEEEEKDEKDEEEVPAGKD